MIQKKSKPKGFFTQFMLGGISTALSQTIKTPLQFIRIRFLYMNDMLRSGSLKTPYTGVYNAISRISKQEGVRIFWKGNSHKVILSFFPQSFIFALNGYLNRLFDKNQQKDKQLIYLEKNLLSGGLSGSIHQTLAYPLEYARSIIMKNLIRSKTQESMKFTGLSDIFRYTVKTKGIFGLYKNFSVACTSVFIYRGFYFGVFDSLKTLIPIRIKDKFLSTLLLAWIVDVGARLVSHPFNIVRNMIKLDYINEEKYKGPIDCIKKTFADQGIKPFFKGVTSIFYGGIFGGCTLAVYDRLHVLYFGNTIEKQF